jgi:hypothetical protein
LVEFHPLQIDVDTAENVTDEYPGTSAPVVRESNPRPKVNIAKPIVVPRKLATALKL